jgi:hypothetical protein
LKFFFGFLNPFFLCVLDKGYNSVEAAINLLKMKILSAEQIAQAQGLTVEKVIELKSQVDKER